MDTFFFVVGLVIFGGYFIMGGLNHFTQFGMMSGYAKAKGVPAPSGSVALTGAMLLLGGLSMLLGVYSVLGVILLVVFLIPVSFVMHAFWKVQDSQMRMGEMINFTKNMALLGALLMFLAVPRPWPLSL